MYLYCSELWKVIGRRIILVVLIGMFLCNFALGVWTSNYEAFDAKEYKELYTKIKSWDVSDEELKVKLTEEKQNFSYDEYVKISVYEGALKQLDHILSYRDFLDGIQGRAEKMTKVSIFGHKDSFSYRSIIKTPPAYEHLYGNQPEFGNSKTLLYATNRQYTDILALLFIFIVCSILVLGEKEKGWFHLIRTAKRGRVWFLLAKLFAVYTSCFIIYIVLYSGNFLTSYLLYGSPEVDRLIQSVDGFLGSTLNVTILTYILVYSLTKIMAYCFIATILVLLCVIAKNSVFVYSSIVGVSMINTLLYTMITDNSYLSGFKFINIVSVLNTNKIYMNYFDINFFGYPLNIITISVFIITIGTGFFLIFSLILFAKQKNLIYQKSRVFRWFKNKIHINRRKVGKIWFYEGYKLLFVNKAYLILLFMILFGIYSYSNYRMPYTPNDIIYKTYVMKVEGKLKEETYDFLDQEQERFDDLSRQMEELYKNLIEKKVDYITYNYMASEIQQELQKQVGFQMLKSKVSEIQPYYDNNEEIKPWIIYDTGYNQLLLGAKDSSMNMVHILFLFSMIACFASVYAHENMIGINKLLNSTKHGRHTSFRSRIRLGFIFTLILYVAAYLPNLCNILKSYGVKGINAPLQSLTGYTHFPFKMSILCFLCLVYILRLLFAEVFMLLLISISYHSKNISSVFAITGGLFLIPYILWIFNVPYFDRILWNPYILVYAIFQDVSHVLGKVITIGNLIGVAALSSVYIVKTNKHLGKCISGN